MQKYLIVIFVICSLILYLLTLKGIYGNPVPKDIKEKVQATDPFELSPERGRFALVSSLAEDKSFALNPTLAEAAAPDIGYHEGKTYIYFPPGISILALPLYWIGKKWQLSQVGAFATISLFALLTQYLLYKIAREIFKLPVWISLIVPLIFGFASTSWSYAVTLYQHHVTAFFILSGFYAVWKYKQRGRIYWIWAAYIWFIYGYSIFIDYPNILLLSPIMIYFFISSITFTKIAEKLKISFNMILILSSVFFIITAAGHAYYNQVNFGDWKRLSGSLSGYKESLELKKAVKKNNKEEILKLSSQKNVTSFFSEYSLPKGFAILTFAIDKGIFIFSPIYLLAIIGIIITASSLSIEKNVLLASSAVNILLYSSWGDPWGGWAYGPRYLIPSMAILSLFIGAFLFSFKYKITAKIITLLLFLYSLAVALVGVLTTNQVPPKVEADYLGMKYNFLLNYDYLLNNISSSFIYNTFFAQQLTLIEYFVIIFSFISLLMLFLLFILPALSDKNES